MGNQPRPDVDQYKLKKMTSDLADEASERGSDTSSAQELAESLSATVETLNSSLEGQEQRKGQKSGSAGTRIFQFTSQRQNAASSRLPWPQPEGTGRATEKPKWKGKGKGKSGGNVSAYAPLRTPRHTKTALVNFSRTFVWLKGQEWLEMSRVSLPVSFKNSSIFRAHMSFLYPSLSTPSRTSSTSPTTWTPTVNYEQTCAPLQVQSIGSMADMDAPTGYEPNQFTETTAVDPSQSFFHELNMIYGYAESVELPPLDLKISDEQSTELLGSPLFSQEREASADRSQVYHSQRENLVFDSSRNP